MQVDLQAHRKLPGALAEALRRQADVDLGQVEFPLQTNAWTLDRLTLRFLVSLLRVLRPKRILEFGSGLSTRVLAWACADAGLGAELVSIDHDPHFVRSTRGNLSRHRNKCAVSLYHAPLVLRPCLDRLLPMYDLQPGLVRATFQADLVLIDGPPLALGGRAGTLFQAMDLVRAGAVILLDDAARQAERQALALWRETFGEAIESFDLEGFPKGLSAICVREPVPIRKLAEHTAHLAARELQPLLAGVNSCILVDNGLCSLEQLVPDRPVFRFGEQNGVLTGPPADSSAALLEWQRLELGPTDLLIFAWPAFWWFDCYPGFLKAIGMHYKNVLETPRVRVFRRHTQININQKPKGVT